MEEITALLRRWASGDLSARDRAVELIYGEMRSIAHALMRNERSGHLFGTTALVHEAYLRLAGQSQTDWQSRFHFYAAAAVAMRRILVDEARKRLSAKRGGGAPPESLPQVMTSATGLDLDAVALDAALEELSAFDPERARVVELRYILGMSIEETAELLGCSTQAVNRDWIAARAWLARRLRPNRARDG